MKTKPDYTIPLLFALTGLLLSIPVIIRVGSLPSGGLLYLLACVFLLLTGLWNIKYYVVNERELIRCFSAGLLRQKFDMNLASRCETKMINVSRVSPNLGLYAFIFALTRKPKFDKYRTMKLSFSNGTEVTLDERFIQSMKDLNELSRLLKQKVKQNKL